MPKDIWRRLRTALVGPRNAVRCAFARFATEKELFDALLGKRVALVGNAHSLAAGRRGGEIDGADIVIRFNNAPMPHPRSHGTRTDWIAAGIDIGPAILEARKARTVIWTAKLRKLPDWMYGRSGVFLYPRRQEAALARRIGKPPSSGMMVIEMLARSKCREVRIYGFDFFKSLSLSGSRTAAEVPHDFAREQELVEELMSRDARFVLRRPQDG